MNDAPEILAPLARFKAMCASGEIADDPAQRGAVAQLDALHRALEGYEPGAERRGLLGRLFGNGGSAAADGPRGLFIHGTVGRGKSMLMDLFHENAPVVRKRRVHFHDFMLQVHSRLHNWRQRRTEAGKRWGEGRDPIPPLARRVADEAALLCFDEFQVHDITDAMILARLFSLLLDHGVVMVATSNNAPRDLYKNGLQRELFLPFIALLEERVNIYEMAEGRDYRRDRLQGMEVYITPLGPQSNARLDDDFRSLTAGARPSPTTLSVQGRTIPVPAAARGVARFSFDALCGQPLGAADYLAIAAEYHTVVLAGVPALNAENRMEGARFATLIDVLYDHHVRLVCSAAAEPDALYSRAGRNPATDRTVSRLMEMRARDYLEQTNLRQAPCGSEAAAMRETP